MIKMIRLDAALDPVEDARCLDEEMLESATDSDIGAFLGLGFPAVVDRHGGRRRLRRGMQQLAVSAWEAFFAACRNRRRAA